MAVLLVIVDDLDFVCVTVLPVKADAPLIVDSNTVLTSPPAFELLEPVPRRHAEILQALCCVYKPQLSKHDPMKVGGKASDRLPLEKALRVPIGEAVNHLQY
jgi:hypothetical protein